MFRLVVSGMSVFDLAGDGGFAHYFFGHSHRSAKVLHAWLHQPHPCQSFLLTVLLVSVVVQEASVLQNIVQTTNIGLTARFLLRVVDFIIRTWHKKIFIWFFLWIFAKLRLKLLDFIFDALGEDHVGFSNFSTLAQGCIRWWCLFWITSWIAGIRRIIAVLSSLHIIIIVLTAPVMRLKIGHVMARWGGHCQNTVALKNDPRVSCTLTTSWSIFYILGARSM